MSQYPNYVREGARNRRRSLSRRSSSSFMRTPIYFKIFFAFVLVMMVVLGAYGIAHRNDFSDACASQGGTVVQEYSVSVGGYITVCKNSDGAITQIG